MLHLRKRENALVHEINIHELSVAYSTCMHFPVLIQVSTVALASQLDNIAPVICNIA